MKITLVCGCDWEGIYVDGKLVHEDHQIQLVDGLRVLGTEFETVEADAEWLAKRGTYPKKLSAVKREA